MQSAAEEGTLKLYLDDFTVLECEAIVQSVTQVEGGVEIVLDQSCFYPGGGGQPCDIGSITWEGGSLEVRKVRKDQDGVVYHLGVIQGIVADLGVSVRCSVNADVRQYHSRLHSAGHLIDLAVQRAELDWEPGRGAHYPDMSFVEYDGEFNAEHSEAYREKIQTAMDAIIASGGSVTIARVTPDEARIRSAYIPEFILKKYELIHLATYNGTFDICCGGTHVAEISDIGPVVITKVKKKDKVIRVSYSVERK